MILLYLDQCHWSDIARRWADPSVVRNLTSLCHTGKVQPVLSVAHIFETLQCNQPKIRRLLVECLQSIPSPIWIKSYDMIIRDEVSQYLREFLGQGRNFSVEPFCADPFVSVGLRQPAPKSRLSVRRLFRLIARPTLQRRFFTSCDTESTPLKTLFHARSGPLEFRTISTFIERYVRPRAKRTTMSPRLKRAFVAQFDLERCPALLNLVWMAHHMSRAGMYPDSSDILDLYHAIPAYSYCSVFVTDKRIADLIRRLRNPEGRFATTFKSLPAAMRHIEKHL